MNKEPIVNTYSGKVKGFVEDDVCKFYGIPYARPPINELRWREPQEVNWSDTINCDKFGPICHQVPNMPFLYRKGYCMSEDCLYLNIWTSSLESKKPVIFWIHGGGFMRGAGSLPMYDGTSYAESDVVVVSINYRIGVFGFLAHPLLSQESEKHVSGNYGLLDQIFALKWIKRNIEKFGGDPENITVMGQSAGAISIASMLISPLAKNLFNKAIIMSGLIPLGILPLKSTKNEKSMEDIGTSFQNKLDISKENTLKKLRDVDPETLLSTFNSLPEKGLVRKHICFDGYYFEKLPIEVYQDGKEKHIPIIIVGTENEGSLFTLLFKTTRKNFSEYLKKCFKKEYDKAHKEYDPLFYKESYARVIGDFFMYHAELIAHYERLQESKVYRYNFSRYPFVLNIENLKAMHAVDVPYIFNNMKELLFTEWDHKISEMMQEYVIQFINGKDKLTSRGIEWENYSKTKHVIQFGNKIENIEQPRQKHLELIEKNLENLIINEKAY